ncbi:MAG: hypothetical protein IIW94_00015 [Clostridia bacterium]|nr:hypothetical protein [Clostridia bacterium]
MNYKKIMKELSLKENIPIKVLEKEMQAAIYSAGLNCSVKDFIKKGHKLAKKRLYIA